MAPFKKVLSELSEIDDLPLYVYLFDYDCQTRSDILPESVLRLHYGKFHSSDVPFVLNLAYEGSKFLPANESDKIVTGVFARMLESFLRDDLDKLAFKKYGREDKIVNRISCEGLTEDCYDCLPAPKRLSTFKGLTAIGLLKIAPNTF